MWNEILYTIYVLWYTLNACLTYCFLYNNTIDFNIKNYVFFTAAYVYTNESGAFVDITYN